VDLCKLGTIIRERREALGLTQSRLARFSGLSRQTLVGLETGALSAPRAGLRPARPPEGVRQSGEATLT
jgi:transcriptional regulator with XRE-family HTH domain